MFLVGGIVILAAGIILLVLGVVVYAGILSALENGTCTLGEPQPTRTYTEDGVTTTEYQGKCASPTWGVGLGIAGLAGIAGGIVYIAKSRTPTTLAKP